MNKKALMPLALMLASTLLLPGLSREGGAEDAAWSQWRQERLRRLRAPVGWLSLAGLFWLREGENTLGGGEDCLHRLRWPDLPPLLGTLRRTGKQVVWIPAPQLDPPASLGDQPIPAKGAVLSSDATPDPVPVLWGDWQILLIERGGAPALRIWNRKHPRIQELKEIPCWPRQDAFRVKAHFVPFPQGPREMEIGSVIGTTNREAALGTLHFKLNGQDCELTPLGPPEAFELIFSDPTNGKESYAGGRFLQVPPPDAQGNLWLDFNRATNPPCHFSSFATCPIPMEENHLKVAVTAGEKVVPGFAHGHGQ